MNISSFTILLKHRYGFSILKMLQYILILYMKKNFNSDGLRAVQFTSKEIQCQKREIQCNF